MDISRTPLLRRAAGTFGAAALLLLAACGQDGADAAATPSGGSAPQGASGPYASAEAAAEARDRQQAIDLMELGFVEGDEDTAPVRVIEFSDFGCIHCANFHIDSYHALHDEFMTAGDVVWKYIPITIGGFPNGTEAAVTGECAGAQGRFARMRDHLFVQREEWMTSRDPDALFAGYARHIGLDIPAFEACYTGDEALSRIERGNRIAGELGVRGTPTFIVQGFLVPGAPPLDAFQEALRQVLAEARGGDPDGE